MNRAFLVYEMIRMSGATNMFLINRVIELAKVYFNYNMTKEQILDIMKNYGEYSNRWLDKSTFDLIRAELASSGLKSEYDTEDSTE